MLKFLGGLALLVIALAVTPVATAQQASRTTITTMLAAANEIPGCPEGEERNAAGRAIIRIDQTTGEISYRVVARRLPGTISGGPGAHIHVAPAGETGPVVLPLELTGRERGLVAEGTVTEPALAEAILAAPADYYVNVHTTVCTGGAIRGQLGEV